MRCICRLLPAPVAKCSRVKVLAMAAGATPAIRALLADGAGHTVHSYDHDQRSDSYGTEAVEALRDPLGTASGQIFKTLVLELSTGSLAVAVLPVSQTLSLKAAAAALGAPKATMADRA